LEISLSTSLTRLIQISSLATLFTFYDGPVALSCASCCSCAMMKLFTFSALIAGSAVASGLEFQSLDTRQSGVKVVNTTSGPVSGHLASNATANVAEYLGIPFAQPPVGELRFAPPQPYNGSSSINGTSYVSGFRY
jgi:hypothetical protein